MTKTFVRTNKHLKQQLKDAKQRIAELEDRVEELESDALDAINDRAAVVGELNAKVNKLTEALRVSQAKVASALLRLREAQKLRRKAKS